MPTFAEAFLSGQLRWKFLSNDPSYAVLHLFIVAFSLVSADLFPFREVAFANEKLVAVLLVQCLVVMNAALIVLHTQRDNGRLLPQEQSRQRLARLIELHVGLWSVSSICVFVFFDWSRLLQDPSLGWSMPLVRLLSLLCVVSPLLLSWALLFDAESALADCAHTTRNRWSYVSQNTKRFLLVPVVFLFGVAIWSDIVVSLSPYKTTVMTAALRCLPLPLVAMSFPWFLRLSQANRSLPSSPLRARIRSCCQKADYAPADVLMWNTEHSVRNAALAGFFSSQSYLLLTDRLLSDLSPKRIEMIVLHEIAHTKHAHHWKLLLTLCVLSSGCASLYWSAAPTSQAVAVGLTLVSAGLGILLFSKLAQQFELEADLWAAQKTGDSVEYLRSIADLASGDPDRSTWMHPSFQRRCEFLLNEVEKSSSTLRWKMHSLLVQIVVWVFAVSAIATILTFAW